MPNRRKRRTGRRIPSTIHSTPVQTSLARHAERAETSEEELAALRQRVWRKQAIAVLPLRLVLDAWERQFIDTLATRLYGPREKER